MSKLSKAASTLRKKWMEAAIAKGGKNAKIVISQSEAQSLVYTLLRDSFRPMNITSIHDALKAVVPPPVLKTCLEAISVGNQDQEYSGGDECNDFIIKNPKKKSKTPPKTTAAPKPNAQKKTVSRFDFDTLQVKGGRNANTTLYFCNQTKLENSGNGLNSSDHQDLMGAVQEASAKLRRLSESALSADRETSDLLHQPTNEELQHQLHAEEIMLSNLREEVSNAQRYAKNKAHVKRIKQRSDRMVCEWHTRKRKCVDFLDMIEDATEGTVNKKKCLAGTGQIELESDETSLKEARAAHKYFKQRNTKQIEHEKCRKESSSFIGVILGANSSSGVIRVPLDNEIETE